LSVPSDFGAQRAQARAAAARVEGWLSEAQGEALFNAAARATGRGRIVEIGSWKGRSTVWLASGARLSGQRVYAVDRHVESREAPGAQTFDTFLANIRSAGVEEVVTPLVMSSADAANCVEGGVEVLFIDGDHSDAGARADVELWVPRLVDGGVILMHDVVTATYTGPRRAFRRRICWSGNFADVHRVGSMGVATRVSQQTLASTAWSWVAGILLYVVDVKHLLRKARGK
jgi:MMP 1-O-methyltransferase